MEKFRDLPYQRPDVKALKRDLSRRIANLKAAKTFEEADAAFLGFQKSVETWETQETVASIRNTMNMTDAFYDAEMKFYNREDPKLMLTMKKAIKAVLASPFSAQLKEKYGAQLFKEYEVQMNLST